MTRTLSRSRLPTRVLTQRCIRAARLLLLFIGLLLITMPWSEHHFSFDGFLREGASGDLELNLLCSAALAGLLLLLSQGAENAPLVRTLHAWIASVVHHVRPYLRGLQTVATTPTLNFGDMDPFPPHAPMRI